jgi:hypothetical protein
MSTATLRSMKVESFISIGCLFLLLVQIVLFVGGMRRLSEGAFDFRHLYTAGYMVRTGHGHEIYDWDITERFQNEIVSQRPGALPFNHLAFEALLLVPVSVFTYKTAYFLWMLVNAAALICCFLILRSYAEDLRSIWRPLPIAIFVCFFPFALALVEGQDSIVLTALFAGAILAMDKRRDYLAGALLAAGLFKFQFVLPVVVLFAAWKRWRVVAGFSITAIVVLAISLAIVGPSSVRTYVHYLLAMSTGLTRATQEPYGVRPFRMANLRGLFYGLTESVFGHFISQVLTGIGSVVLLVWAGSRRPSISLATVTSILVSYHCLNQDLSLLVIPVFLAPNRENSSAFTWASAAAVFAGPGLAFAFGIPMWLLSIPILWFLIQIARLEPERFLRLPTPIGAESSSA